ncbi:MAG TPA: glutamate--cysteine ligase [Nitrosospira sp.]|nr:glutamate--cysteine ligase [Nitrosospira sp.]
MRNDLPRDRFRPGLGDMLRPALSGALRGIEKESLRMALDGSISRRPHPARLGSALAHPYITTDYSEALLELITPALSDTQQMLDFLAGLHQYVCTNIEDETLLATSMPVGDLRNGAVPIARYGSSNPGSMKHIYRQGLEYRYGSCMQVIAGIHFNYSLPPRFWPQYQRFMAHEGDLQSFTSDAYMGLIRNLQRYGWLILYLLGSSPAVSKSFVDSRNSAFCHTLEKLDKTSYYRPYATSLRMSEIGYVNPVQATFQVSFNSLDEYIRDLTRATSVSYPDYEKIGVKDRNGQYKQLNTYLLQIENEYYTSVRPKQPTRPNERPLRALRNKGVQYIEIRSLDVDIFEPLGISIETVRFLEAFILFCLLEKSPKHDRDKCAEINSNALAVANNGRQPGLKLSNGENKISLRHWASMLCEQMEEVCDVLDEGNHEKLYWKALQKQMELIRYPDMTSSARMLSEMREHKISVADFSLQKSGEYTQYFKNQPLSMPARQELESSVTKSLMGQKYLESGEKIPFEDYLDNYFRL